jgi:hypothetical protein
MAGPSGQARSAIALGLAGSVTLFAALLTHEILSFGATGHDVIAHDAVACTVLPCVTLGTIVTGHMAKAVGTAIAFVVIGALLVGRAARGPIAALIWVALYLWSLVGIASGYKALFGSDWAWWEPFTELAWSPGVTLGLMLLGLLCCAGFDRVTRAA